MVGDFQGLRRLPPQVDAGEVFADVLGKTADSFGLDSIAGVLGEHMPIILDHRSASRSVDDDGVDVALRILLDPRIDKSPRSRLGVLLVAEMMRQRPAAPGVGRDHHLDAKPREQPHRCGIDAGIEHALRASR